MVIVIIYNFVNVSPKSCDNHEPSHAWLPLPSPQPGSLRWLMLVRFLLLLTFFSDNIVYLSVFTVLFYCCVIICSPVYVTTFLNCYLMTFSPACTHTVLCVCWKYHVIVLFKYINKNTEDYSSSARYQSGYGLLSGQTWASVRADMGFCLGRHWLVSRQTWACVQADRCKPRPMRMDWPHMT